MVNVALGADHGGYRLKQEIIRYLEERGIPYKDFDAGIQVPATILNLEPRRQKAVASGEYEKGIVICTTGIGISITANKVKGIRCALCSDTVSARLTREHNDANMLALGAGIVGTNLALSIVEAFLGTDFSGEEKHRRRVEKIKLLEED